MRIRRATACALLMVALASCGGGGGGNETTVPAPPAPVPSQTAAEALEDSLEGLTLDEYFEVSFKALYARSPEAVVAEGAAAFVPLEGASLDDLSAEYLDETHAMYQVALDAIDRYDASTLEGADKINYQVYRWYLSDRVAGNTWRDYRFVATYFLTGVEQSTRRFFTDLHPLENAQDAEDYLARLAKVDTKFRQAADQVGRQQAMGIVEPAVTLSIAQSQLSALLNQPIDSNPYLTAFAERLGAATGVDASARDSLVSRARSLITESVIPGYRALADALEAVANEAPSAIGVGQYPDGAGYYSYLLGHHTTTDMTADEVHTLGLEELDRVHAELAEAFSSLDYPAGETLAQSFARAAADGGIVQASAVKAAHEELIAFASARVEAAFDVFPSADVVVADDPFGGYYIGPSLDGTRPGAFYAGTSQSQRQFELPTLTFHETIPGHHTQISIALEQDVPVFRKLIHFTAFVEGWALYAERLAFELGWYDSDPYGNLGRLEYEALRAARLVIDTGIHSRGWSLNMATTFNVDNVGAPRGVSTNAVLRYSVYPGQATAYMVGMLRILAARQRAIDALGSDFNLIEFHRLLLTAGAMPLDVMDEVVDNYIAAKQAGKNFKFNGRWR